MNYFLTWYIIYVVHVWEFLSASILSLSRMFDAFAMLDGKSAGVTATDDRCITLTEWRWGWPNVKGHGFCALADIDPENAAQKFADIHANSEDAMGKGTLTLQEWCVHLKQQEIEQRTLTGMLLMRGDDDPFSPAKVRRMSANIAEGKVQFN